MLRRPLTPSTRAPILPRPSKGSTFNLKGVRPLAYALARRSVRRRSNGRRPVSEQPVPERGTAGTNAANQANDESSADLSRCAVRHDDETRVGHGQGGQQVETRRDETVVLLLEAGRSFHHTLTRAHAVHQALQLPDAGGGGGAELAQKAQRYDSVRTGRLSVRSAGEAGAELRP